MKTFTWIAVLFTLFTVTMIAIANIALKQNCTGYLKRAANANTIELAKQNLDKALSYIEAENLTSGYTSILWRTPDEDIEYWYTNLKACQNELANVDANMSQLESTNILMKLRETLTESDNKKTAVIYPEGLSRYPYNTVYAIASIITIFCILFIVIRIKLLD